MSEDQKPYEVIVPGAEAPPAAVLEPEQTNGKSGRRLSAADLADVSKFNFRFEEVELPEIGGGGTIMLRSLSVEERENLPDLSKLMKLDEKGERTEEALKAAGVTFALIVVDPKLTPEAASAALRSWPIEAYDRVNQAYDKLLGGSEEEKAAYREFPAERGAEVPVPDGEATGDDGERAEPADDSPGDDVWPALALAEQDDATEAE